MKYVFRILFEKALLLICLLTFSCKTISVANESQTKTTQALELGMIGEDKHFILEADYNSIAIPIFDTPVKLSASIQEFNASIYKAFVSANESKQHALDINYADSLKSKPKFLKLELADRVSVLNMLNDEKNRALKNYLLKKKDAHLVSAVSIVLSDEKTKSILSADALFLEQDTSQVFSLKAYKNNEVIASFKFGEGVVFAYQASNFCWQEDDKYQIHIADIVENTDKCPNRTYRDAKRAEKKIDYYKF